MLDFNVPSLRRNHTFKILLYQSDGDGDREAEAERELETDSYIVYHSTYLVLTAQESIV